MNIHLRATEGFDKTYLPLQFRAFWDNDGYCYMRVQIRDGCILFTCAQLLNYHNTSVTNAVENIREAIVSKLFEDGALKFYGQKSIFDRFKSRQRISFETEYEIFRFLNENSYWLEYYPSELSLLDESRYSVVAFNGNSEPVWGTRSREALEKSLPLFDLNIDEDVLANWNDRLSSDRIKNIIKRKGWTMRMLAERWSKSEKWISNIVNDENRGKHWEDAIRGLPSLHENR